jgi:hypothetical protein
VSADSARSALPALAEEGIAIIPSFAMPACRNRKVVVSQLINPAVRFDSNPQAWR